MDYIYIISCQRGQGSPEIQSIWMRYEDAIKTYYEGKLNYHYIYKIPVNQIFGNSWSDIKLQKSCKYRLKIEGSELKNEYQKIIRDDKINSLIS